MRTTRTSNTWGSKSGNESPVVIRRTRVPTETLQEDKTNDYESMQIDNFENSDDQSKDTGLKRIKKKKVPGMKNIKTHRYAKPKNAVMCLNELQPGVTYVIEESGNIGKPMCVYLELNGQKYRGFGSSKQMAKQAAAEAALISFVKPPPAQTDNITDTPVEDDKTPWAALASFALYKLFNNWREGRVGVFSPPAQPFSPALSGFQAFADELLAGKDLGFSTGTFDARATLQAHTDKSRVYVAKPAKSVPEKAANMHPVMVLHQMRPNIQYATSYVEQEGKKIINLKAEIDGQKFTGKGNNMKEAKLYLAKKAISSLFGVDSTFEITA